MKEEKPEHIAHIIGLGLDAEDGHVRITKARNFSLFMGSEETHEQMQQTCIKIDERLERKGKELGDLTREEFLDMIADVD